MTKVKPKINAYAVIKDKVEEWVPYGIRRYYKYKDNEKEVEEFDVMVDNIVSSVMLGLSEVIDFD